VRKYELSLAADRDLDDIYTYTFREFGVLQADAYFESLQECLITLGDNPLLGVDASGFLRDGRTTPSLTRQLGFFRGQFVKD